MAIGIEDFTLIRVIGRGSYAKVFAVEQKRTKRKYAMKVVKKELVNDDEVRYHVRCSSSCLCDAHSEDGICQLHILDVLDSVTVCGSRKGAI